MSRKGGSEGRPATCRALSDDDIRRSRERAEEVSLCATAVADMAGRLVHVNPAFVQCWGFEDQDEILNRLLTEFWESPVIAANVVKTLKKTAVWSGELIAKRKDGTLFRVKVSACLARDGAGKPVCMVGTFMDISVQARALESLMEQTLWYRSLVEATSDWVWEVNHRGVYVYSNPKVEELLGYKAEEVLANTPFDFMPEGESQRVAGLFAQYLAAKAPFQGLENVNRHRDGHLVVLETSGVPIHDEFGRFQGYRGIDRDITKRKKAQAALQRARDELEARVEERTRELKEAYKDRMRVHLHLQGVFNSISDAIITVDRDVRLLNANRALRDVCARADGMRLGETLQHAFVPGERSPCLHLLEEVLRTGKSVRGYRAECQCGIKTNQVTMLNASPLMDDRGEFAGAVLVVRDVTRLDELERKLYERSDYRHIIGKCKKIQEMYDILTQLKDLKTTLLITGESGTGKEMVVDALHYSSSTITGPLVKVNCSALAENLLESELFGHVRGAFTGAVKDKVGRFEAAEGGTIFLDEIGDIAPSIQLKLLRILERKEYERVGDSTTSTADVRVVAATNSDLWEKVQQGQFRMDLYYRLRVMVIDVPPLRERTEDIPLLAAHFVNTFANAFNKDIHGVTDEVMRVFMHYPWPGNVRELKHTIEHASILCGGGPIATRHLPVELEHFAWSRPDPVGDAGGSVLAERDRYLSALEQTRWNKSRAAAKLGVSRTTLYRKIRELDIED